LSMEAGSGTTCNIPMTRTATGRRDKRALTRPRTRQSSIIPPAPHSSAAHAQTWVAPKASGPKSAQAITRRVARRSVIDGGDGWGADEALFGAVRLCTWVRILKVVGGGEDWRHLLQGLDERDEAVSSVETAAGAECAVETRRECCL